MMDKLLEELERKRTLESLEDFNKTMVEIGQPTKTLQEFEDLSKTPLSEEDVDANYAIIRNAKHRNRD